MDSLLLLALLACPIGMGLMMWMMARGQRNGGSAKTSSETGGRQQVAQLRAEIDELKADRDARRTEGTR